MRPPCDGSQDHLTYINEHQTYTSQDTAQPFELSSFTALAALPEFPMRMGCSPEFEKTRREVQTLIGYTFNEPLWLQEGLYAGGPTTIEDPQCEQNSRMLMEANKTLAQLGDAMFKGLLNTRCHSAGLKKALISAELQRVATNKTLDQIGRKHGLEKHIKVQHGCPGVSKDLMATAVQAILGAVWVDSNENLKELERVARKLELLPNRRDSKCPESMGQY